MHAALRTVRYLVSGTAAVVLAGTCGLLPAAAATDPPGADADPAGTGVVAPSEDEPTPEPTPGEPTPGEPTPEPTPVEPTPGEPTPEPSPEPSPEPTPAEPEAPAAPVRIDLLEINDFHARLEPDLPVPGAAAVAGAVNSVRATNPNTLFVSAGDNFGTSPFTSLVQDDAPTIEALNMMGLDVSAVGNHELFKGRADFDERVRSLADFPHLAANLYDRATGRPAYDEYWVTEVDGVTVGFIGAMTESLYAQVTPTGVASLEVRPIVSEVNRVATQLSDGDPTNGEADVLVLLVHEGPASSAPATVTDGSTFALIAAGVSPEVDVIFAGHTHKAHAHLLPVDGWPEGLRRPVAQSGLHGRRLARVTLDVDPATGDVVSSAATLISLPGTFAPDPEVEALVAAATARADAIGAVPVGQITGDVRRALHLGGISNLGGESAMANLVASAHLWATQDAGAQIAFTDPGGVWANLLYASGGPGDPDGNVTYREVVEVQSHDYRLVTMTLTGRQVVDVLEEQWHPTGSSRPSTKLGIAGLTYTYDPTAERGHRIGQAWVGDQPLDLAAAYTVVANTFIAAGGNGIATFGGVAERRETGVLDVDALERYLRALTPVTADLAQRAVGVHVAAPDGGFAPGAQVTADLSSLLFSAGEVQDAEVTVSIAGAAVGAFPVDPTVVDYTDEVGRATVTFAVPPGTPPGDLEVVVSMPGTGTRTSFVVPVAAVLTCAVDYDATRLWGGVLVGSVTVLNTGNTAADDWRLAWDYLLGERALVGVGARVTQVGSAVTANGAWWQRAIEPGSAVTFAILGTAPQGIGTPAGFALNGVACSGA